MMRKLLPLLLTLALVLAGCASEPEQPALKQFTATFLNLFDTVTTIVGRAESEEAFQACAQEIHDDLLVYHRLFDIYNDYEGVNNLKTVNDNAGTAPVKVDAGIIALLKDCRDYCDRTGGAVNVAMGSVLELWHNARSEGISDPSNARLPDENALREAAQHADFSCVLIDEAASTVYLSDPKMRLDVGAIAKGWAAQRAAENAPEGMLISIGGNVCATGPKDANGTPWVIGVQNPDGEDYLHTLFVARGSVVTSGDYQRGYVVDGEVYHHIIDPESLYPARKWRSVTVVCEDSGLADALSTALFILPLEEGLELLAQFDASAMWVNAGKEIFYSPGFEELIRT